MARFSSLEMYRYFVIYWPEEGSVSTVERDAISCSSGREFNIGVDCDVTVKRQKYKGRIAARGNEISYLLYASLVACTVLLVCPSTFIYMYM